MECLVHADEQHIVQNDEVFCPVCTLSNSLFVDSDNSVQTTLDSEDFVVDFDEIYFEKKLAHHKASRAPPQLV